MSGAAWSEIALRPATAYEDAGIDLRTSTRVDGIDRTARILHLSDGSTLAYDRLALCTGGRPRPLPVAGTGRFCNLHYLRTHEDAAAIRPSLSPRTRLVIVGGGYVGLEIAAAARQGGADVTVLEAQGRLLARVASEALSSFYDGAHRANGVAVRTDAAVIAIESSQVDRVTGLRLADGTVVAADAVVVGVGMLPNVELAVDAGLTVDGGIVVDELSATSDPAIFAAGDCTVHDSHLYGRRVRLESVPNALEQARAAVSALCGNPKPNRAVPWFWSNQYGYRLQMVGLHEGHDRSVVRGDMAAGQFSIFYLHDGRVLAAAAVNRPGDFVVAKRLVAGRCVVDPVGMADEAVPLKAMLARAA